MAKKSDGLSRASTASMRANNRIRTEMPSYRKVDESIAHKSGGKRFRGRRGVRARARLNRRVEAVIGKQPSGGDGSNS